MSLHFFLLSIGKSEKSDKSYKKKKKKKNFQTKQTLIVYVWKFCSYRNYGLPHIKYPKTPNPNSTLPLSSEKEVTTHLRNKQTNKFSFLEKDCNSFTYGGKPKI